MAGVVLAIGVALLIPLAISFIYADGSWDSFLAPSIVMILSGGLGRWWTKPSSRRELAYISNRDVLLSVTAGWLLAALLGGVPYLIEGTFTNPINSTFESMSGFTTTGATLLPDIEAPSPSILFWRSMTQWLGGIGIVVLFVAVAPVLGFGAAWLLSAEVSGIGQPRLTPRIVDTAKVLLTIYLTLSVAEVIALLVAGMNLYDAVLHAFTTIATGGFNPKNASVGFYDSIAIEVVIIIFVTLSAVSFSLYFLLYTQRSLKVLLDRELLTYLGILVFSIVFVWSILIFEGEYGDAWWQALRYAAFDVTSILTTTGYITADFDEWDTGAKFTLLLLMFIGGVRRVYRWGHKGHPRGYRVQDNPRKPAPGCPSPGGYSAQAGRSRHSRKRAHSSPGSVRGVDTDLCVRHVSHCNSTKPRINFRRFRRRRDVERHRAGSRAGWRSGELYRGEQLRTRDTNAVQVARAAGDINCPCSVGPRILAPLTSDTQYLLRFRQVYNPTPHQARHELYSQLGRAVLQVQDRVDLDHVEGGNDPRFVY